MRQDPTNAHRWRGRRPFHAASMTLSSFFSITPNKPSKSYDRRGGPIRVKTNIARQLNRAVPGSGTTLTEMLSIAHHQSSVALTIPQRNLTDVAPAGLLSESSRDS